MPVRFPVIISVFFVLVKCSFGQADTMGNTENKFAPYSWTDNVLPKFKGGESAINKILKDSLVYPKSALKDRVGGKVIVHFKIDTLGNVVNVKVTEGVRDDLNREAIRLVSLLKGWTPGSSYGKKVNVIYKIPIYFYPDSRFKRKYKKEHKNTVK